MRSDFGNFFGFWKVRREEQFADEASASRMKPCLARGRKVGELHAIFDRVAQRISTAGTINTRSRDRITNMHEAAVSGCFTALGVPADRGLHYADTNGRKGQLQNEPHPAPQA